MQLKNLFLALIRHHFWGALGAVVFVSLVISAQLNDRTHFANTELYDDVMDRWGAPINQPAPSVRYVPSGSVFTTLQSLPLESQDIVVHAHMNYRKRGLAYFSGFEFDFHGKYLIRNPEEGAIDIAFVVPLNLQRNKSLLSNMTFLVDGSDAAAQLDHGGDKLVWTGRMEKGSELTFDLAYHGRGLDNFNYRMDPAMPVRNFNMAVFIKGGDNYDYAAGDMPAHKALVMQDEITLEWRFPSLESGVPIGVILPSEKSFSNMIRLMVRRGWVTWLLFFAGLTVLTQWRNRTLKIYETYLIASGYGFTFVLLAYLAAFMNFYLAYVAALLIMGGLLLGYLTQILGRKSLLHAAALITAFMITPTIAVIMEGYTGLIYTLEILSLLALLMRLSTQANFQTMMDKIWNNPKHSPAAPEVAHA